MKSMPIALSLHKPCLRTHGHCSQGLKKEGMEVGISKTGHALLSFVHICLRHLSCEVWMTIGRAHLLRFWQWLLSCIFGQYNCYWLLFLVLQQVQHILLSKLALCRIEIVLGCAS